MRVTEREGDREVERGDGLEERDEEKKGRFFLCVR